MPAKREANRFKKKTPAPAKPAVRRKSPAPRRAPRNPDREPRQWIKLPSIPKPQLGSISPERKLDIAGSVIALVGLLTLLSLLSIQRGLLTGLWIKTLANLFGWGVYVLPIGLMAVGLWLVFRHIEHIPIPSLERLVGIIMLYCNLLAWISLIAGNSWDLAKAGKGGGYLGAVIERALVIGLGKPGALVALLAWLIIGLAFSFDLSIPELLQKTQPLTKKISQPLQRQSGALSNRPYIHHTPRRSPETPDTDAAGIPPDFQPLPDLSQLDASKPQAASGDSAAASALRRYRRPDARIPKRWGLYQAGACRPALQALSRHETGLYPFLGDPRVPSANDALPACPGSMHHGSIVKSESGSRDQRRL